MGSYVEAEVWVLIFHETLKHYSTLQTVANGLGLKRNMRMGLVPVITVGLRVGHDKVLLW